MSNKEIMNVGTVVVEEVVDYKSKLIDSGVIVTFPVTVSSTVKFKTQNDEAIPHDVLCTMLREDKTILINMIRENIVSTMSMVYGYASDTIETSRIAYESSVVINTMSKRDSTMSVHAGMKDCYDRHLIGTFTLTTRNGEFSEVLDYCITTPAPGERSLRIGYEAPRTFIDNIMCRYKEPKQLIEPNYQELYERKTTSAALCENIISVKY